MACNCERQKKINGAGKDKITGNLGTADATIVGVMVAALCL